MTTLTAPPDTTTLTGLEIIQALRDGRLPRGEAGELLDMRISDVDDGRVVFEIDARPEFSNPLGSIHGGILATLLDSAMGCAVHTTLPAGVGYTTVDLAVTFVGKASYDGSVLRGEGHVVHRGGRIVTAEGRVVDATGRLVATATTTCLVLR
jgi:uncharacterized protein (TIGR00369 family)